MLEPKEFGKGIPLGGGFDIGSELPVDNRTYFKKIDLTQQINPKRILNGMIVYSEDDDKLYRVRNKDAATAKEQLRDLGAKEVYVGTEEPQDEEVLWIDPSGTPGMVYGPQGPQGPIGPSFTVTSSSNTAYLVGKSSNDSQAAASSTWYVYSPYMSGATLYATDFVPSADIALKKDISPINKELATAVTNAELYKQFRWKENDKIGFGMIAQELEKIAPELVDQIGDKPKSIHYIMLHSLQLFDVIERLKVVEQKLAELCQR